ncbi:hypothetical protein CC1G_15455 [Coprinopsis cinerea okayama7|uniref:Uncharacterized protein n=1 Tax=Coprinopsis cinerea (strain Okayama-7 / 130 / ATCC MYA-4618 / FGSC 9003) TaxID=240176 RepID=D6RQP7_COPC7|nr:hypothetical protein CC1G_15455 [Coprinopsis cinerea okayama7\|eukprot:XP_002910178.1 hypothetical protein CC1G_15455 [Coprinopsis cinerea okayama7\
MSSHNFAVQDLSTDLKGNVKGSKAPVPLAGSFSTNFEPAKHRWTAGNPYVRTVSPCGKNLPKWKGSCVQTI